MYELFKRYLAGGDEQCEVPLDRTARKVTLASDILDRLAGAEHIQRDLERTAAVGPAIRPSFSGPTGLLKIGQARQAVFCTVFPDLGQEVTSVFLPLDVANAHYSPHVVLGLRQPFGHLYESYVREDDIRRQTLGLCNYRPQTAELLEKRLLILCLASR